MLQKLRRPTERDDGMVSAAAEGWISFATSDAGGDAFRVSRYAHLRAGGSAVLV
jgi:hypothetical protein